MNWVYVIQLTLAGFFSALICSYVLGLFVQKTGIVDAPDENRKQQSKPVARLGGVAIFVPIFAISFALAFIAGFEVLPLAKFLVAFTIPCFFIGLWDDIKPPSAKLKLMALLLVAGAAAYLGVRPEALNSPLGNITSMIPIVVGSALWLLVFTNAANFMDGSNGLTAGSIGIMLIGILGAKGALNGEVLIASPLLAVVLGAIIGFLIHNLRGKLYAGDAGALGLGALFASLGLVSGLEVWTIATLALPFLIDVLMTLIWRAKHKRSWLEAHLDHAYQRLRVSGWSHLETAVLYWGLTATCAAAAVIAAKAGGEAPFIVFWTLCLAGIALWTANRRMVSAD